MFVVFDAGIFIIYGGLACYARRPFIRVFSFACMVFGLVLCLPHLLMRGVDPTFQPSSDLFIYSTFAVGDIVAHAGLMMLVYWDICMEAVHLVYSLETQKQSFGFKICRRVGAFSVLGQVVFLVPFWILMHKLQDHTSRSILSGSFFVVQCFVFFGLVPAFGFGMLAHGLRKLRGKLPPKIPRHLTHRLRFTQLGIGICLLLGVADALFALLPAAESFVRSFSGFLYLNLVLHAFAMFLLVLLTVVLWLSEELL